MDSLLKEFKSAMIEAEKNDTTVRVSIYGRRIDLTCIFNFPQIEIVEDYICITDHDSMNRFVVDEEYEIEKEEDCDDLIYKIIGSDIFADVEIYT